MLATSQAGKCPVGHARAGDGGGGGWGRPANPALTILWVTRGVCSGLGVMGPSEGYFSSMGGGTSSRSIITPSLRQDGLNEKRARWGAERRGLSSLPL